MSAKRVADDIDIDDQRQEAGFVAKQREELDPAGRPRGSVKNAENASSARLLSPEDAQKLRRQFRQPLARLDDCVAR